MAKAEVSFKFEEMDFAEALSLKMMLEVLILIIVYDHWLLLNEYFAH